MLLAVEAGSSGRGNEPYLSKADSNGQQLRPADDGVTTLPGMGLVQDLLGNPGMYVGKDTAIGRDLIGAARIVVARLPGGAGVSLDYELLNALAPGPVLGHVEHTMVGVADDGSTIMVIAHTHGAGITILHETDPGTFEPGDGPLPYPMKVVLSVPAPGRLRHSWWYGAPGDEPAERDVAELELITE